jgi:hypothetical protein
LSLDEGLFRPPSSASCRTGRASCGSARRTAFNRYDGAQVAVYAHDASNADSLPNNVVWAIVEDAAGDVWWRPRGRRALGAPARPVRPLRYAAGPGQRQRPSPAGGPPCLVWIGTRDAGLDVLDPRTGAVRHFRHRRDDAGSLSDDNVYAIAEDRSGVLWVGTNGRLDPGRHGGALVRFVHDPKNADTCPAITCAPSSRMPKERCGSAPKAAAWAR